MAVDYTVPAIHRAVQALDVLVSSGDGLSLAELAKRLRVPKSTLFRIMVTLQGSSIVNHDPSRKTYSLGMKLVEWGHAALERIDLKQVAHPHLERLAQETKESFYLGVLEAFDVILIDRADTPEVWQIVTRLGARSPAHVTAIGQVLLSEAADEVVAEVIAHTGLRRFTDRTITSAVKFRRRLEEVRRRGYAITDAEYKPDLCALAVPIRDHHGTVIASLMTALPSDRAGKRKAYPRELIALLKRSAMAISRELGNAGTYRGETL